MSGSIVGVLLVSPFFNGALPVVGELSSGVTNFLRTIFPFTSHAGRVSTFVPTAVLFLLFSLPLFIFCRDHNARGARRTVEWKEAFRVSQKHCAIQKRYPGALRFLLASFLYQDAIGTIVQYMALYAVMAMGFEKGQEVTLFVVLTIPAAIGSYFIGSLSIELGRREASFSSLRAGSFFSSQ